MALITYDDKDSSLPISDPRKLVTDDDLNEIKDVVNDNQNALAATIAASAGAIADAKVADAINNGTTTVAPSQNAVFDALALKANSADVPLLTSFVDNEGPTGAINGVNLIYTIAHPAIYGSVKPYWNGLRLIEGVGFTRSGQTLTMTLAPETGDSLVIDYMKEI